jgi:hypothetical protein
MKLRNISYKYQIEIYEKILPQQKEYPKNLISRS